MHLRNIYISLIKIFQKLFSGKLTHLSTIAGKIKLLELA